MNVFNLPDLGEGLPDAQIVTWHVKIGDEIKIDQLLVSVETAKAVVDIPSPQSGIIEKLCVNPGDVLNTGQPLVIFKSTGSEKYAQSTVDIKATPAVRALAKKLNINLSSVQPSGPNNSITIADLETIVANQEQDFGWQPVDHITKNMAVVMQQSHIEIVPATIFEDLILPSSSDLDLTVNLMQSIVFAVSCEPSLNSWFKKDLNNNFQQKIFKEIDLGIAVDSKDGLFVPVIRNVASKSAANLREELNLLRTQIETKKVTLDQLQDPTFILSNFGKFAGRYATPIILPPTVAILAVGKLRQSMVVLKGSPVVKMCAPLSLTFDHRAVTGGQAARFLRGLLKFFSNLGITK